MPMPPMMPVPEGSCFDVSDACAGEFSCEYITPCQINVSNRDYLRRQTINKGTYTTFVAAIFYHYKATI